MKFPVMTQRKKIICKILWVICIPLIVIEVVALIRMQPVSFSNNYDLALFVISLFQLVFGALVVIILTISAASHVRINEKGVTLVRCGIKCAHIAWDEVRRVEMFESFYRRSAMYPEIYITVSTSDSATWAYIYKHSPQNLDKYTIAFAYDYEAHELIKQHYADKIYAWRYSAKRLTQFRLPSIINRHD